MQRVEFPLERDESSLTARSKFTITAVDVGTEAVRPGVAEQLEQERDALLLAGEAVLERIRKSQIGIGAAHEFALEAAIRMARAGS